MKNFHDLFNFNNVLIRTGLSRFLGNTSIPPENGGLGMEHWVQMG